MRRAQSFRRSDESGGEQGFWPSYADMMSAVALILFFLMLLSYIQNLITGNDLQNTQEVLASTQQELLDTESQVKAVRSQLQGLTGELEKKQDELEAYAVQIASQTETITDQQKLIGDQEKYLAAANTELVQMRNQMQSIAVFRLSVLQQIKDSIVKVTGDDSKVSIGDNGNIILSDSVLFDLGSSAVKPDSAQVIKQLSNAFVTFLSDESNRKYVDSIVISGHTDFTGTEWENQVLSTERANSVLNYMYQTTPELQKYSSYFCAAGYGETRPVASNDTEDGMAQNRRIEISIILKDDSVIELVDKYLKLEIPSTSPSPAPANTPIIAGGNRN